MKCSTARLIASLSTLAALAGPGALLAACDGARDQDATCRLAPLCQPAAPGPIDVTGEHTQYVVDSIRFKMGLDTFDIARDLDCTGDSDNQLGYVLAFVYEFLGTDLDALTAETVTSGRVLHLIDVQARSLEDADEVGIRVFAGRDVDGQPGDNFSGLELFEIDETIPSVAMAGSIASGVVDAQHGEIPLQVALPGIEETSTLTLIATRVDGTVTEDRLALVVSGALTPVELETGFLVIAHTAIQSVISSECADAVCPPGSRAEEILSVLDEDMDGELTFEELRDSSFVEALLAPDVDILDEQGRVNLGCDGKNESLSLAVEITAVPARFNVPRQ